MKVGKSGVLTCDHCGEPIIGEADVLIHSGEEKHFCPQCLGSYIQEIYSDDIANEVEKRVRQEFNLLHKQVCPACRWRMQKLF